MHGSVTGDGRTTWSVNSDRRIKDNIEIASYKECYENLKKMNLFKFNYKEAAPTEESAKQDSQSRDLSRFPGDVLWT